MTSRSAFLSPPAVAGLALFAVVLGAIFGLRIIGGSGPEGDTEVAGTVVERTEPAEAEPEPADAPDPVDATDEDSDPIVVPQPDEDDEADEQAPVADEPAAPAPAAPAAPAPAAPAPPTVGLIRDEPAPADDEDDSNGDDTDRPRQNRPDRQPEPTEPSETPTPDVEPTPEDRALREGEGHSRDTAIAEDDGWLFQEVTGHGNGGDSLEAQARLTVGFDDAAKRADGPVRALQCQAWLTAGEGRLTTDADDHVFEIALLALDDNGMVTGVVTSVLERRGYELEAGESTAGDPMATTPIEVDAADGVDYTCGVQYRER